MAHVWSSLSALWLWVEYIITVEDKLTDHIQVEYIYVHKSGNIYLKLKTWRWKLSMAKKKYNSFHLSTKGAQHQFTGNLHWFTLALQVTLHHPSYKSWGKTEQKVTFEQYQSLMCRSWKQAQCMIFILYLQVSQKCF